VREPYRDFIEEAVRRDRTAKAIWQDLVDDHEFTSTYECVKRFVRRLRGETPRVAHPRIVTAPGEEAQVDYEPAIHLAADVQVEQPDLGEDARDRIPAPGWLTAGSCSTTCARA
jgi:hypothetical protein